MRNGTIACGVYTLVSKQGQAGPSREGPAELKPDSETKKFRVIMLEYYVYDCV